MKIAAIFTILLFWGIVAASPPFREINGKPVALSNLDNQEQQNKKISDLETIIPSKGESDKDDWKNKVWKRSIFPLFQKDSIPILNKDGEDKKDLGLVLNGLKIGKKIVDHALQALAKLVQKSDGDKSSLKSDELDKLTEILPENKPHEVKKRENVKLLNVGGKNVEAGKKNVNKSLRKASEQIENQKKAAAKKQEIFNSIPTITIHKELKNTKSDDKKNDNASPVNKQKRSNAEELTNVQRNKRGTSMSLWNTSDNDSKETNDVVTHSHVSAVLKNRYASVAEAINSGLAIQKIIQRANANVAEAQKVDDDFEIDLHNEFTKWLDDSLEYGLDSDQHIDQHLPSHPPIPKQQDKQTHGSAYRSYARSSSNAQATASEHDVPVIKPHDYENSDLRWQYNNNPGYDNQHYPKWMWQNRHFDEEKNDHDRNLHDHSIRSHKLGESEHGPNENIKNIHWQNNVETTYGGHNMYGWKNLDEYRENSGVPTATAIASSSAETKTAAGATQEGTFIPSTWFIKDQHSSSNDNGMPITWTKAETSITNQGSWNNADSSAIASASTSTQNNARNNAHGYQRFLSNEWLVNDEIENNDHYDIPNIETKISGIEDHSFLKHTYEPSVLTLEDEIENAETLTKSKAKASAQSRSEKSWNRKDSVSDAGSNKSTATNTAIRTAVGKKHKSSEIIAKEMIAIEKDEAKTYAESTAKATSAAKSVTTIENKNKETGGSATVISESASVATNTPSSSVKKLTTIPNEWLIKEKIVSDVYKTKSDAVTTPSSSTSAGITAASKDRHGPSILSVKEKIRNNKGDAISGARINADTTASSSASASVSASTSASAETSKQSKDTTPEKIMTEEKSQNGDNTVVLGHSLASNSGTAATNEEKHRLPQWSNKDKPLQKGTDSEASIVRDEPSVSSNWLAKHPIASNIHGTMPGDASSMSSTTFAEPSTVNKKKQNSQNTKHGTTSGKTITTDDRTNVKDSAIRVVEALREDKKEVPQKKVNIHNYGFGIANHEMRIPPDWLAKRGKGNFYDTELQWHDKNTLGSNTNNPMLHDTSSSSQTADIGAGSSSEIPLLTSSSIDATINDNESGPASVNTNVKTSAEANSSGENKQKSSTLNWKDTNINEQGDTILDRMTSAKATPNANGGSLKQGKEKVHQKIVDSKSSRAAADSATFASGSTLTAVNKGSSGINKEHKYSQWPSNEKTTKEDDNGASFARENGETITGANAKSTRENNDKSQHNEGATRTYGDDSPRKRENVQSDWHPANMLTISDSKSGDNLGDNIRQVQWSKGKTNLEDDNTLLSAVEGNAAAIAETSATSHDEGYAETSQHRFEENIVENGNVAIDSALSSGHADSIIRDNTLDTHEQSRWNMKEQQLKRDHNAVILSLSNAEASVTSPKEDQNESTEKSYTSLDRRAETIASASSSASADTALSDNSNDKNKQSQWITEEENVDAVAEIATRSEIDDRVEANGKELNEYTNLDEDDAAAVATASSSAHADSVVSDSDNNDHGQSKWEIKEQNSKPDDNAVSVSTSNAHAAAESEAHSTSPKENIDNRSGKDLGNRHTLDGSDSVAIASASASVSADSAVNENSDHKDKQSQSLTKEENPNALFTAGTTSANIYKPETNMKQVKTSSDLGGEDAAAAAATSSYAHADSEVDNSDSDVNRQSKWKMNEQDLKHDDAVAKADVTSPQEVKGNKSGEELRNDNTLDDGDSVAAAFASASANADAAVNDHSEDKNKESRPIAKEKQTDAHVEADTISKRTHKPEANEKELNKSADLDEDNATTVAAASSSAQADSTVSDSGGNGDGQSGWKMNEQDSEHDNSADPVSTSNAEAVAKADVTSPQEVKGNKSGEELRNDNTLDDGDSVAGASASSTASSDAAVNDNSEDKNKESRPIAKTKHTDAHVEADTISESTHRPEADKKELNKSADLDEDNATAVAAASSSAQADSTVSDSGGNGDGQSRWKLNEQDSGHDDSADSVSTSNAEAVAKTDVTSQQEDIGDKSERRLKDGYTLHDGGPVAEASASASANADAAVDDYSDDKNKESWPIAKRKSTDAYVEADTISASSHRPGANKKELNRSADLDEDNATTVATALSSAQADVEAGDSHGDDDRQLRWKINEQYSVPDESADSLATSNAEAVAKADSTSPQEVKGDTWGKELGNYHTLDGNDSVAVASASSSASSDAAVKDDSDYKDKQSQLIAKETNADTLAEAGITSERKNKVETNEKKLKKSVDLDESDTIAVATASSSAHAGHIIDDSGSDDKSRLRWQIKQENPKHDDSSASLSTSNAEADVKVGALSLGEDKEDKLKNGYAKLRGSDADAIASTSASTNANSAVDDNSDDNHKQSQLITTAETPDSVAEAGSNWRNEDEVDKSGKDLGNYATLDGRDSVAVASASASASAASADDDNSDHKNKQSQTLTKEQSADALAEARTTSESRSKVEANEKELKKSAALNDNDAAALTSESALSNTDFVVNDITDNNHEQSKRIAMEKGKKSVDREIPIAEENTDTGAEAVDLSITGHKWEQSKTDLKDYTSFGNSDSVAVASASGNSGFVADDNTVDEHKQSQLTTTDESANTVVEAGATFMEEERTKKTETSLEKHATLDGNDSITVTSTSESGHADSAVDDNSDNNSHQSEWMTTGINKKHHDRVIPITEENVDAVAVAEPSATSRTQNMNEESKTSSLDYKKLDDSDSIAVALASALGSANSAVDDNRNDKHKQSQLRTYEKNTNTDVEAATSSQNEGADFEEDNAVATASSLAHADSVVSDNGSNDDGKWKMDKQDTKHDNSANSVSTSNAEAVAKEDDTSLQEDNVDKSGKDLGNYHTLDGGDSVAGASASSTASSDAAVNDNSEDENKESRPIAKTKYTDAHVEADTISESTHRPEADKKELNKSADLDEDNANEVAAASSSAQADSTVSDSGGYGDGQSRWKLSEQDSGHDDSADSVSTSNAGAVAKTDVTSRQEDIGDKSERRLKNDYTLHDGGPIAEASASALANADAGVNDYSEDKNKESRPIAKEKQTDGHVEADTISKRTHRPEADKKELNKSADLDEDNATAVAAASSSAQADSTVSDSGGYGDGESRWKMNEQEAEHDDSADSISTSNAEAVAKADATSPKEDNVDKSGEDLGNYHTRGGHDSGGVASASASVSADSPSNDNSYGKDKQSQPIAKEANADAYVESDTISESIDKLEANEKELKGGLDMGGEDAAAVAAASSSAHADSVVSNSGGDDEEQSRWKMNKHDSEHDDSAVSLSTSNSQAVAKADATSPQEDNVDKSGKDLGNYHTWGISDSAAVASAPTSVSADLAVNDYGGGKDKQSQPIAKEKYTDAHVEADTISKSIDKPKANEKELKKGLDMGEEDAATVTTASSSTQADSIVGGSDSDGHRQSGWKMNEQDSKHDASAVSVPQSNAETLAKAGAASYVERNHGLSKEGLGDSTGVDDYNSVAYTSETESAVANSEVLPVTGDNHRQPEHSAQMGLENDYSGFESSAEEHTYGTSEADTTVLRIDDAGGLQDGSEDISNSKASSSVTSKLGDDTTRKDNNKPFDLMNVQDYNDLLSDLTESSSDASDSREGSATLSSEKYDDSIVTAGAIASATAASDAYSSTKDKNDNTILNNNDIEHNVKATIFDASNKAETLNKKNTEHPIGSIEDMGGLDYGSDDAIAVAKTAPVNVYKYILSKGKASDDKAEGRKHAQSDSAETGSTDINWDKLVNENVDYNAKDDNLITDAKATASAEVTPLAEAEADSVSTNKSEDKQDVYLENINAAADSITNDGGSSRIENMNPTISSWKEKEDMSARQNTNADSSANTKANNMDKISNEVKEDGWLIKWKLNDHSLPITAINKDGAREISQKVGPIIPSTMMTNPTIEKNSSENIDKLKKADLIVMRKQYGHHKPMSITYIRNSIPPMVVYRVIPKSVYEQVRELITQGDIVHTSYGLPQISKA